MSAKEEFSKFSGVVQSLVILALDANLERSSERKTIRDKNRGGFVDIEDQGSLLRFGPMKPQSAYTFDAIDNRIYAADHRLLLEKPWEILGDRAEVMTLAGDSLKWFGFKRLKAVPKEISVLGKVHACYD